MDVICQAKRGLFFSPLPQIKRSEEKNTLREEKRLFWHPAANFHIFPFLTHSLTQSLRQTCTATSSSTRGVGNYIPVSRLKLSRSIMSRRLPLLFLQWADRERILLLYLLKVKKWKKVFFLSLSVPTFLSPLWSNFFLSELGECEMVSGLPPKSSLHATRSTLKRSCTERQHARGSSSFEPNPLNRASERVEKWMLDSSRCKMWSW